MRKNKKGKKTNGFIGCCRFILMAVVLLLELLLLFCSRVYFGYGVIVVYIVGSVIYYYYLKFSDKYHVRAINDEEYQRVLGKKLIHYTDFFNDEQFVNYKQTGLIKLIGNPSARSNYRMRYENKSKKFVWFHTESEFEKDEPDFNSFAENHFCEGIPRKYKILIDASNFEKEQLFINPANGNILVLGDVLVTGRIDEKFNWYNDKLYLKSILGAAKDLWAVIPVGCQQTFGNLINLLRRFIK